MLVPELLAGPYTPPACIVGDLLDDEVDGRVEVGGWTSAPISWPRRKKTGRPSLILTPELARAVRMESVEAVCYWWGVGATKVWMWRKALGVGRVTDGTRQLLQARTGVPADAAAAGRARAALPEARARMAQAKRGRPASSATREALRSAAQATKPAGWGMRANAWMLAGKQAKAMALAVQAARVARADAAMMGMELSPAVLRGRAIVLAIDADGGAWSLELISDDGVQSWVRRPMRAEDIEACECLECK